MVVTTLSSEVDTFTSDGRELRSSFLGVMRGEWLKLSHQWLLWIMCGLLLAGCAVFGLVLANSAGLAPVFSQRPSVALYSVMQASLFLIRVFWGMALIVLTARLIGMEYSGGTIRVLLGRGVGRLQLLFGKLAVMGLVALVGSILLAVCLVICDALAILALVHNLDVLKSATATFWADTRAYAATVVVSMGVSILMAAAVTTLTRSLAVGLTTSVAWFPVDNMVILILVLGRRLTHWDFWSLVSGDFLGLNLNVMGGKVLSQGVRPIHPGLEPLTPVTAQHTFLVTAIYAVTFLVVAVTLTVLRDVKE